MGVGAAAASRAYRSVQRRVGVPRVVALDKGVEHGRARDWIADPAMRDGGLESVPQLLVIGVVIFDRHRTFRQVHPRRRRHFLAAPRNSSLNDAFTVVLILSVPAV